MTTPILDEFLELATYNTIISTAREISDHELARILTSVERTITHLESSDLYKQVQLELAENKETFRKDLTSMLNDMKCITPNMNVNLMVWIIGLRVAAKFKDFNALHIQMSTFIIAQKLNLFRITDDRIRLILTHFHFTLTGKLISDGRI